MTNAKVIFVIISFFVVVEENHQVNYHVFLPSQFSVGDVSFSFDCY
jgi:hypothetical protein